MVATDANDTAEAFGKVHVPLGPTGEGLYTLATVGCFNVMARCQPLVLEALPAALTAALAQPGRPLSICDFGAADGGTSVPMWHAVVAAARQSHTMDISMAYEDQANNDWNSLFAYTSGKLRVPDAFAGASKGHSFVEDFSGVYVSAVGTSFHVQCLPRGTLHLGFSSTAMHWLSAAPAVLPSCALHHTQLPATEPAAAAAFAAQAAADWERILLARAAELAPGGRLVLANFCVDEQGQSLGRTHACPGKMFDEMKRHWAAMAADGKITQAEFDATTFISYYRSPAECTGPLQDTGSAVYAAGLRLVSCVTAVTPCPFRAAWIAGTAGGDAAKHAAAMVLTTRTWSNSTFESALSSERTAAEKRALVDELFDRYAAAVAKAPGDHGMDYVHAFMVIEKV